MKRFRTIRNQFLLGVQGSGERMSNAPVAPAPLEPPSSPTVPTSGEIVGAAEVSVILGIGNTNFSHLRRQRAGRFDAFPEPLVTLKCGPIWRRSDAEAYARTHVVGRRVRRIDEGAPVRP